MRNDVLAAVLAAQTDEQQLRWASVGLDVRRVDEDSLELKSHLGGRVFIGLLALFVSVGNVVAFALLAEWTWQIHLVVFGFAGLLLFAGRIRTPFRIVDGSLWVGTQEVGRPMFSVRENGDEESPWALIATTSTGDVELWACTREEDSRWLLEWLRPLLTASRVAR